MLVKKAHLDPEGESERERAVCRFGSLAELEMEDIDIPRVAQCGPGQQGVKQPIR